MTGPGGRWGCQRDDRAWGPVGLVRACEGGFHALLRLLSSFEEACVAKVRKTSKSKTETEVGEELAAVAKPVTETSPSGPPPGFEHRSARARYADG